MIDNCVFNKISSEYLYIDKITNSRKKENLEKLNFSEFKEKQSSSSNLYDKNSEFQDSDSDDDILGINNKINGVENIKCRKNNMPRYELRNNVYKNRNRSQSLVKRNSNKNYEPWQETRKDTENNPRYIKNNGLRYQRMREVRNITGFIVNVHDATNFDIDLEISPELYDRYRDVISNQYTYQDLGQDFLENPDLNRLKIKPIVGTTYRCRLRGVGINQLPNSDHTYKNNIMCVEVKQLIDRSDGWVNCTLSDIDVYQRLLVDIEISTGNGVINLRDYLLNRMSLEENPIFYPYSGKKFHNTNEEWNISSKSTSINKESCQENHIYTKFIRTIPQKEEIYNTNSTKLLKGPLNSEM